MGKLTRGCLGSLPSLPQPGFGSTGLAARRAAPGDAGTRPWAPSRSSPEPALKPSEEKSPPIKKRRRPKPVRDGFIHFPDVLMVSPLFAGR